MKTMQLRPAVGPRRPSDRSAGTERLSITGLTRRSEIRSDDETEGTEPIMFTLRSLPAMLARIPPFADPVRSNEDSCSQLRRARGKWCDESIHAIGPKPESRQTAAPDWIEEPGADIQERTPA